MQDALKSLEIALNKLCIAYEFQASTTKPMTMIETIEKLETMQGCACLKNLYAGARPRWQVFTPLLTEKISFKVYYKKNHGTKLGLAILEMTPSFFNQYGIYNNSSFWDILEENTVIPIYGVIWKENKLPLICHCGD